MGACTLEKLVIPWLIIPNPRGRQAIDSRICKIVFWCFEPVVQEQKTIVLSIVIFEISAFLAAFAYLGKVFLAFIISFTNPPCPLFPLLD